MQNIRLFLYKHSTAIVFAITSILTIVCILFKKVDTILQDQNTLVTLASTLAGFLFTGQGILLTLSPNNAFYILAQKHGYIKDFHHHCRYAELSLLIAALLSIKLISNNITDICFIFLVIFGLLFTLWALLLFGSIVRYYCASNSDAN